MSKFDLFPATRREVIREIKTIFKKKLIGVLAHGFLCARSGGYGDSAIDGRVGFPVPSAPKGSYWFNLGEEDLLEAERTYSSVNTRPAKNVVIFIGDGLGVSGITATRIYKGQKLHSVSGEEGYLSWDRFPNMGLLKVPDSGSTATALFCGLKTNYFTIGVDSTVKNGDCTASLNPSTWLPSIFSWGQDAGMLTGFITTRTVTDATPAALYAHTAERAWEYDRNIDLKNRRCKDIARQLVEYDPGRKLRVVMGGGRLMMGSQLGNKVFRLRKDGRNLTQEWLNQHSLMNHKARYVTDIHQLEGIDFNNTDALIGLFSDTHMTFESLRPQDYPSQPSLQAMTAAALKILSQNDKGFLLMVESGNIDIALHGNQPRALVDEVLAFDDAVEYSVKHLDLKETLVIVTSDHSHGMTLNGYARRGNDILGLSIGNSMNGDPFTTLLFATGPGISYTCRGGKPSLPDVSKVNTRDFYYEGLAGIPTRVSHHAGEDVAVHAIGPMSHLFHRVHEQSYVAHAISYAACIGHYKKNCSSPRTLPRLKLKVLHDL